MIPHRSTPVPNIILDVYLPILKPAELCVLLVIIRQTLGWQHETGEHRKHSDWISGSQLLQKTGCSRKSISTAIDSLHKRGLIYIFDEYRRRLDSPEERQGKMRMYYAFTGEKAVENAGTLPATCVKSSSDLRTFYAQQKKLLQKKLTYSPN